MCPKRTGTITCPPTDRSSQTGEEGDRQRTRPRPITITQMGTALTTDTIKNLLNKVTKILLSFEIFNFFKKINYHPRAGFSDLNPPDGGWSQKAMETVLEI